MKKVAIAFSSKDRVELTRQSLPRLTRSGAFGLYWNDGSATDEGKTLHEGREQWMQTGMRTRVTGGPDCAIVFALSQMLSDESNTHVGLLENDTLLDPDWFEPTLALFDYSKTEGLPIGAVSARAYEDRVLIQRDGYAVMHNVGAGHVIFTREAAQILLANYRTGWWPENRAVFSQLSGLDIGKWACFGFNEQMITADWAFDTILAAHGLATVALTPSKATMIGQVPSLEEQGLRLVDKPVDNRRDDAAFNRFRENLLAIQHGNLTLSQGRFAIRSPQGNLTFAHHLAKHGGTFLGNWTTKWSQGFGPFAYVAGDLATIHVPALGPVAFHVGGGPVSLHDEATGFTNEIDLTSVPEAAAMQIPRDMQYGNVNLKLGRGTLFYGMETLHPQPVLQDVTFDYSKLPEVG